MSATVFRSCSPWRTPAASGGALALGGFASRDFLRWTRCKISDSPTFAGLDALRHLRACPLISLMSWTDTADMIHPGQRRTCRRLPNPFPACAGTSELVSSLSLRLVLNGQLVKGLGKRLPGESLAAAPGSTLQQPLGWLPSPRQLGLPRMP